MGNLPQPHVVVIPCPFQGHLMPVVKLSLCLVERGVKITMLIPDSLHVLLIDSLPDKEKGFYPFDFVTFPCEPLAKIPVVSEKASIELQELVKKSNAKIACVIADELLGHTSEVARILGIPLRVFYSVASVGFMAFQGQIPKMIDMGVIDENGGHSQYFLYFNFLTDVLKL
ncbi:hypothetical protein ACHQM5_008600 [Ranunculus cassubicifolius]